MVVIICYFPFYNKHFRFFTKFGEYYNFNDFLFCTLAKFAKNNNLAKKNQVLLKSQSNTLIKDIPVPVA